MPRPPRLVVAAPPHRRRISSAAAPSCPTTTARRSPSTPTTTATKRPRSSSTRAYTSGAGSHPNLAWLAAEIKRLAFPPSSPYPPPADGPHPTTPAPQYFPTPFFPLRSQDVGFLAEPSEFYEAILERIRNATSRVTLSALYLGTGELEQRLVRELTQACQRRPGLRVRVLLDYSRARRGGPGRDSLATLAPLLAACPRQAEVALFRMPQLASPWGRRIPSPLNEVMAVSHLKALVFDDALLLTGSNLSNDYFTTRQDRYVAIQNAGALAAFYHELVALLARFPTLTSSNPDPDAPLSSSNASREDMEPNADTPSSHDPASPFHALARALRRLYGQPPFSAFPDDVAAADTLALPTLQCAPLGIRHEEHLLLALLRAHATLKEAASEGGGQGRLTHPQTAAWELTLATAYLNPPSPLLEALAGWPGPLTLLAPAAAAHGFAGAKGLKSWIPLAYLMHEHRARQHLHALRAAPGAGVGGFAGGAAAGKGVKGGGGKGAHKGGGGGERDVHVFRYARPGWTFHGKGLWLLPSQPGAGHGLSVTVAGSSNYGVRSFERDLESQVLLLSRSPQLRDCLSKEKARLLGHAEAAGAVDAAAHEIEAHLGAAFEYPWRRLWLPRLAEWTRDYL